MSKEYKKYLRKIKIHNLLIFLTQIIILILFIYLWQYLANKEIINTFIMSSPKKILSTIINLYTSNNLFKHIWITSYEVIISFILSMIIGIFIAIILWSNNFIYKVLDPYLTILNSLPKVSLGPIIIIWLGANIKSIIIISILISSIITTLTIYNSFQETDINKINLLKTFKSSKYQILKYLIIPNSYKIIISTLKINISMSLIGVITGELLISKQGIGYLIMYGSQIFNLSLVISSIIILLILSSIMYIIVIYIEKILIKN